MTSLGRLALLVALTTATPCAVAQSEGDDQTASDEAAREAFQLGRTEFGSAHYAQALGHFERSYELSHLPDLLYNLALCHDRLREDEAVIDGYERFVQARPDSPEAQVARDRMTFLRTERARRAAELAARASADAPTHAPDWGWGLVIGGAVGAALGGVLLAVGVEEHAAVESLPDGASWSDWQGRAGLPTPLIASGAVTLGLGIACALGGVIALALVREPSATATSVTARLGVGDLSLRVRF